VQHELNLKHIIRKIPNSYLDSSLIQFLMRLLC